MLRLKFEINKTDSFVIRYASFHFCKLKLILVQQHQYKILVPPKIMRIDMFCALRCEQVCIFAKEKYKVNFPIISALVRFIQYKLISASLLLGFRVLYWAKPGIALFTDVK